MSERSYIDPVAEDAPIDAVAGCPPQAELAAFAWGGAASADLAAHLQTCARCAAIVATRVETHGATQVDPEERRAPLQTRAPGAMVGRYRIDECLGVGGMGVVYRATDTELDRAVALKLVRPLAQHLDELTGRLRRESRLQARAAHRAVITVHDIGRERDQVYVAMELVRGGTLRAWLASKPRSWREILDAFREAASGLAAAHAAGLVHRDFKPDNVLVEHTEGVISRVLVTDFGVARAVEGTDRPGSPSHPTDVGMTATGSLIGTPAYMSPEQLAGRAVDPRSDVFSFSVSLWEALYGERPFPGDDLAAIIVAMERPARAPPPRRGRQRPPRWIETVVRSGLAIEPARRTPSINAVIPALDWRRRRRTIRIGAAVAAACAIGGPMIATRSSEEPCVGADRKLVGVWDARRMSAMRVALSRFPDDAWARIGGGLDRWSREWTTMHVEACRATARGEQSERALDLRMQCLDERRREAAALVVELSAGAPVAVDSAVAAVGRLPPIEYCADVAALEAPAPVPIDRSARAVVAAVRDREVALGVKLDVGRVAEAGRDVGALVSDARATRHLPTGAKALALQGRYLTMVGAVAEAEQSYRDASLTADAGRDDRTRADAELRLLDLAIARGDQARVAELIRSATAVVDRLDDTELRASIETARANAAYRAGDYAAAEAGSRRAVELLERDPRTTQLNLATAVNNLVAPLIELGRLSEARDLGRRALALAEEATGLRSTYVANSANNLAAVLQLLGEAEEAAALYRRALAVYTATNGESYPETATTRMNLATALTDAERFDEAAAELVRACASLVAIYGPDHTEAAACHNNLGKALLNTGDVSRAESELRAAIRVWGAINTTDSGIKAANARCTLGEALIERGRADDALVEVRAAKATLVAALGAEDPDLAYALVVEGKALLHKRRPVEAIPILQRALDLQTGTESADADLVERIRERLGQAQALARRGQTPRPAR